MVIDPTVHSKNDRWCPINIISGYGCICWNSTKCLEWGCVYCWHDVFFLKLNNKYKGINNKLKRNNQMKLKDLIPLTENTTDWVVYKVTNSNNHSTYYGYGKGNLRQTFLAGANRNAADRTEAKYVNAAGGIDNCKFKEMEIFDNEYEAFMERNDLRSKDPDSITGPSRLPSGMFERALKENPKRVSGWKLGASINDETARGAMKNFPEECVYDTKRLRDLVGTDKKLEAQVKKDLDSMTYPTFIKKYNL